MASSSRQQMKRSRIRQRSEILKFKMMLKTIHILFGVFLLIPLGNTIRAFDEKVFCFDSQIQDALLACSINILVTSLQIKTINDTTGVKQRFHLDYLHPKTVKWTTYQEDRYSKIYYLPSQHEKDWTEIQLRDPIIGRYLRISLLQVDSLGWLGEICANIKLKTEKRKKPSCSAGSYGDGEYCTDINECADTTGNFCPRRRHCNDSPGKYSCLGTCLGEFFPSKKGCVADYWLYHKFVCDKHAQYRDGTCVCDDGYSGDGIYCFDHCITKGLTCHPQANCVEGGCTCRSGYKGNGEICQAICSFGNVLCHPDAACLGNVCKCRPGFVGDGLSKCSFSRVRYEKAKKEELTAATRHLSVVETDVFEILHTFQRLRTVLNEKTSHVT